MWLRKSITSAASQDHHSVASCASKLFKTMVDLKIENVSNSEELQIFGHDTEIMGKKLQRHERE